MLTDTCNSDTAAGVEFISSHRKCSEKICKFRMEAPVLESLFTKLQAFRPATLLKKIPTQVFSCEI